MKKKKTMLVDDVGGACRPLLPSKPANTTGQRYYGF